jgi:AsmA protein
LCSFYNTVERLPRPAAADADQTDFELLSGSAVVTDGIARTSDLQAIASFMEVTGRGQLDLTTRNINYDLVAKLTDSIDVAGCEMVDELIGYAIPVELTGNVSAPEVGFDLGDTLEILARERLQRAAEEELQNRLSEALEGLFE